LTREQHGVLTRRQLLALGMPTTTIRARLKAGRLHRLGPGVYAVGRPDIGRFGQLMAATLACGPGARIPVADPISVLIDLAAELPTDEVEDAVNEADRLDLVRTYRLRAALDAEISRPGVGRLKRILDAQTFSRAANALERRFLAIVREADLPASTTQQRLGRYRVDFFLPELRTLRFTHSQVFHRPAHVRAVLVDAFGHAASPVTAIP
jgi:hypothetical protein